MSINYKTFQKTVCKTVLESKKWIFLSNARVVGLCEKLKTGPSYNKPMEVIQNLCNSLGGNVI